MYFQEKVMDAGDSGVDLACRALVTIKSRILHTDEEKIR